MCRWRSLLLLLFFTSCNHTNKPLPGEFDKEGLRGCRGLMPENTIPAMLKAIDLGVTTLEMDVCFTSDMKAILSHDPFFNHDITTKPDGNFINQTEEKQFNLYKIPYDSVMKYDVGTKGNPRFPDQQKMKAVKPLLSDVIEAAEKRSNKIHYNIETKTKPETDNVFHPAPAEFVNQLMTVINHYNIADRVVIQSFDVRTLQYLHQHYPSIKTSLLIEPGELLSVQTKIAKLGFQPDILSPEYHLVNNFLIEEMHKKGTRVLPWTVNDAQSIHTLRGMGVDGIITDYPNLFNRDFRQ